ncbi:MAG: hypothetical protein Q7T74_07485 [Candidatus Saccharibacteria bacterium]|nr:hypothetical protein [Candidatus Saccharibacteria bacterium]
MTTAEIPIPKSEFEISPKEVADKQVELAQQWAKKYEDPSLDEAPKDAEIILRNPAFYLGDVNLENLPEDLQKEWEGFLKYCDIIVDHSTDGDTNEVTNVVEKIRTMIESGQYDPDFRSDMAEVMRQAAQLFAKSTMYSPGKTSYYAEKVQAAATRLPS